MELWTHLVLLEALIKKNISHRLSSSSLDGNGRTMREIHLILAVMIRLRYMEIKI